MSKEVNIVKLISGESIVAEIIPHSSKVKVKNPMYFHGGQDACFIPFEPYTGKTEFEFHQKDVMAVWPCLKSIQKGYIDVNTPKQTLDIPEQKLVDSSGNAL